MSSAGGSLSAEEQARRLRRGGFWLEGLNSVSTTWFFYYVFFFLEKRHRFSDSQNLLVAAGIGFIYMFAAFYAGRYGQRHGYLASTRLGSVIMAACLLVGLAVQTPAGHLVVVAICTIGMCFTWPNLEALVSVQTPPGQLPRTIGIYNLVWSGGGAMAFATGGALLEHFGIEVIFVLPAIFFLAQAWIAHRLAQWPQKPAFELPAAPDGTAVSDQVSREVKRRFLKLSWVANPFAYVAINTIVPLIPALARKLQLSPTMTGIFCSLFFFARTGSFLWFWKWAGWHYRWGWLVLAYLAMVVSFAGILLLESVAGLLAAQLVFGLAVGLIYYSSLFYSMDAGEDQGTHGGVHEAAIGAGNFLGPGVGAVALYFFTAPQSGAWAVTGLLVIGLIILVSCRARKK